MLKIKQVSPGKVAYPQYAYLTLFFTFFFILVSPEVTLQSKYYVGRENSVSLDCKVEGYPPPTITWTPCNAQNACDQRMLNISKVQSDCVYTCTAKNSLGNDSASTSLCKPFYLCVLGFYVFASILQYLFAGSLSKIIC